MAVLLITGAAGAPGGMPRERPGHHEWRLTGRHAACRMAEGITG
ncbi:hypothetical protein [Actinoplanes siamensis]|nr:hypothetical protein [Actinoplanes siamensis]